MSIVRVVTSFRRVAQTQRVEPSPTLGLTGLGLGEFDGGKGCWGPIGREKTPADPEGEEPKRSDESPLVDEEEKLEVGSGGRVRLAVGVTVGDTAKGVCSSGDCVAGSAADEVDGVGSRVVSWATTGS